MYAGSFQAGSISEVVDAPNESVIEGEYFEYEVEIEIFGRD